MFGLINRGELDPITEDEFEHLTVRLRALWLTEHNENGTHNIPPVTTNIVPIGTISMWPGADAPSTWLLCSGQAVSRTFYSNLFAVTATKYGSGDGSTTFNIPNLRQKFVIGKASSGTGSTLAGTGGAIDHTHTFTTASAGAHTHTVDSHDHSFSDTSSSDGAHTHTVDGHTHGGGSYATGTTGNHTHTNPTTDTPGATQAVQSGTGVTVAHAGHTHTQDDTGTDGAHSHSNITGVSGSTGPGTDSQGAHTHTVSGTTGSDSPGTDSQGAHTHTGTTAANNPPFISLNFIISTGVIA